MCQATVEQPPNRDSAGRPEDYYTPCAPSTNYIIHHGIDILKAAILIFYLCHPAHGLLEIHPLNLQYMWTSTFARARRRGLCYCEERFSKVLL
jgi:hypothetical protein